MAAGSKRKSVSQPIAPQIDYEALWDANGEYANALLQASQVFVNGMASVSYEVLSFAGERMQRNFEISETLLHCNGFDDALRIQLQHAQSATQEYFDEANKLLNLATQINRDCWAPLESHAEAAGDIFSQSRKA